jgi:outer membrane receptor protein involved in Fe transport
MKHTDITASRVLKSVLSSAALIAATISVIQPTVGFSADAKTSAPADANVTAASKDQAVAMNVFEVKADTDGSYGAVNSNSITMFNTDLSSLPISADIFTKTFLDDVGARTIEDLLTGNVGGAGLDTSSNGAVGNSQPYDRNSSQSIQLHGLTVPTIQRDTFMPGGSVGTGISSTFDVERVEVINGPQSLLYGNGGAGGVINTVSKRARFNSRMNGSIMTRFDQYANNATQIDFGQGGNRFSYRFAIDKEQVGSYRLNVGGQLDAAYGQFALRFSKTVVRLTLEHTDFSRLVSGALMTYTALSTSNDARNGQYVSYLLASNQMDQAANGAASGGGSIGNGHITWKTLNSYEGNTKFEKSINDIASLEINTQINPWLASEIGVGIRQQLVDLNATSGVTMVAPNYVGAINPQNVGVGSWNMAFNTSLAGGSTYSPSRFKNARAALVAKNQFFGGKVTSQTVAGADFSRRDDGSVGYYYYQVDANGNIIVNQAIAATNIDFGRTYLGTPVREVWTVQNGPIKDPLWKPFQNVITYAGNTYVRQQGNISDKNKMSLNNPLGLALGGRGYLVRHTISSAIFAANTLSLFNDRLEILSGIRLQNFYREQMNQGAAVPPKNSTDNQATVIIKQKPTSFSLGMSYELSKTLHMYVNGSDSYNPPVAQANDPYGNPPLTAKGFGAETGIKLSTPDGRYSGTIAYFATKSSNEQYAITSTLELDINPTAGLNGGYGNASVWINVDRKSQGVQAVLTAAPTKNLRLRFSAAETDGTIGTSVSYGQLYNDQFNANAAGNVTYADGTPVYVLPTYNSKTPVVASTTAGAIPLTIAMMNTTTSPYYAQPALITSVIGNTSLRYVLQQIDPVHGAILTGANGLPISKLQIAPNAIIPPPGIIPVSIAGDKTVGYPKYSAIATAMYSFDQGFTKGIRLGGTLSISRQNRGFYYYPNGVAADPAKAGRTVYMLPNMTTFNLIAGYSWKLGKLPISSQLNINNMFNHYGVLILPNPTTGWVGPLIGTLNGIPRTWVWTNTLTF